MYLKVCEDIICLHICMCVSVLSWLVCASVIPGSLCVWVLPWSVCVCVSVWVCECECVRVCVQISWQCPDGSPDWQHHNADFFHSSDLERRESTDQTRKSLSSPAQNIAECAALVKPEIARRVSSTALHRSFCFSFNNNSLFHSRGHLNL